MLLQLSTPTWPVFLQKNGMSVHSRTKVHRRLLGGNLYFSDDIKFSLRSLQS